MADFQRGETISIHAPLTGSDCDEQMQIGSALYFNPRSPYGERHIRGFSYHLINNFNPRSPYGERLHILPSVWLAMDISIHAPLTGSDQLTSTTARLNLIFQSTLPLRGATLFAPILTGIQSDFNPRSPYGERHFRTYQADWRNRNFNPRSPYGERHCVFTFHHNVVHYFNPRSPYGERPCKPFSNGFSRSFQSTLPLRGATCGKRDNHK